MIHLDKCTVGGTFAVKRDVFKQYGGFPLIDYGEDSAFFKLLENNNYRLVKTNERTYIYNRTGKNSITKKIP
jgi:hypothetical protein